MGVNHVTDDTFKKEVVESAIPVLVDFWATWCGPCRMIAPMVEEIAREYEGKLKVCKIDVDQSSQIASHFGIMSIPTLMFFKDGKIMDQVVGALNKSDLKKRVDANLV